MKSEDATISKILAWVGAITIFALPIIILIRRNRRGQQSTIADDGSNVFSSELED
jgi:hypothetical protein